MKKTITRKQVLKAIANEPLSAGSFIVNDNSKTYKQCSVCAVGAVLRSTLLEIDNPRDLDFFANRLTRTIRYGITETYIDYIDEILTTKNYLQALSIKFEWLCTQYKTMKTVRKHLAIWVKKNLPKEFEVQY